MKRWPIIRHIRWYIYARRVDQHYRMWNSLGYLPVNADQDNAVLDRIWNGTD